MMFMMLKLLPVAAMVGGGVANQDEIKEQIDKVTQIAKVVAVQREVDGISKMIYLQYITDEGYLPSERDFADYVRKNMKTKRGVERDTSIDFWENPYVFERDKDGFTVRSAGPDGDYDTDDDIIGGWDL